MANENFSLSFTINSFSVWIDNEEGIVGESSTLFFPYEIELPAMGEASTIFILNSIGAPAIGEASTINGFLLCGLSLTSLPRKSRLNGPEFSTMSDCS